MKNQREPNKASSTLGGKTGLKLKNSDSHKHHGLKISYLCIITIADSSSEQQNRTEQISLRVRSANTTPVEQVALVVEGVQPLSEPVPWRQSRCRSMIAPSHCFAAIHTCVQTHAHTHTVLFTTLIQLEMHRATYQHTADGYTNSNDSYHTCSLLASHLTSSSPSPSSSSSSSISSS